MHVKLAECILQCEFEMKRKPMVFTDANLGRYDTHIRVP